MLLLLAGLPLRGQDIHFSQMEATPTLLNPAYTGFYDGNGRFGMMYRNQWASVSTPFQTLSLTAEMNLWRSPRNTQALSIGLNAFADRAGSLHYGTSSAHLSLAYYTVIGNKGQNILSFGLEGGYGLSGYDLSRADMQDGSEAYLRQQVSFPLLAAGVAWYSQPTADIAMKIGLSARNINRPNISYMGLDDTRLERRYSLFARAEFHTDHIFSLLPMLLVQVQRQYHEAVCGLDLKWYLDNTDQQVALRGGLAYRLGDAVIANFMVEYNAFLFSFCYDANLSALTSASRSIGAFEVGLVYRLKFKKNYTIKCPAI